MTGVDPTNPAPPACITCRHYVPGEPNIKARGTLIEHGRPRCRLTVWFFEGCKRKQEAAK